MVLIQNNCESQSASEQNAVIGFNQNDSSNDVKYRKYVVEDCVYEYKDGVSSGRSGYGAMQDLGEIGADKDWGCEAKKLSSLSKRGH